MRVVTRVRIAIDTDEPVNDTEMQELLGDALTSLPGEGRVSFHLLALFHDGQPRLASNEEIAVR